MLKGIIQNTGSSQIKRNIVLTLVRQILAAAAQLVLVVIIARHLGPEGNGQYAMAILLPTLLVNFLNLGVGPATVYHVGRGDFSARHAVRGNIALGLVVSTGGLILTLPAILLWGNILFPSIPVPLLYLGLIAFPFSILLKYLNTILQGLEEFQAYNWAILAPPYVTLFCVSVALYVVDLGIIGAISAYVIGQVSGLLAVAIFISRTISRLKQSRRKEHYSHYKRRTLGYGWKAHLSNILAFVNYRTDIFLVNFLINPAATGIYVVAVQFAEKLWMLSQAASTVLLPRLSAMHDETRSRLRLAQKAALITTGLTATAAGALLIALYFLIEPLMGSEYASSLVAFCWLLPGVIAGAGARIHSNCIAAAGKPEWNMYVAVFTIGANIGGNLWLIPKFGIKGAAIATSSAYLLNSVVKMWLVRKTGNSIGINNRNALKTDAIVDR